MDHETRSIWRDAPRSAPCTPPLQADRSVDVAIVGGGITGLTLGLLLAEVGADVVLLERRSIGAGTTGATTAHLTEALDTDYASLLSRFGEDAVRTVLASVQAALREIERRSAVSGRDCGFRRLPGFRFAESSSDRGRLEREAEAAAKVGLALDITWDVPLPFATSGGLRFEDQAEIEPLAYLDVLAQGFLAAGGALHEQTPVVDVSGKHATLASGHRVEASHVVDATHTPIGLAPSIQTRVYAMTSYVASVRLAEPLGDGLFWDLDEPYHYVRAIGARGDRVLVGGEDHHTGRSDDPAGALRKLEAWTRARFPVVSVERRWSAELFEPADGLPYIGALPTDGSRFVAAGFSGTGLTFGTVAALLIRDLIAHGESPFEDVYAVGRIPPLVAGGAMAKENASVAWRFVADRLRRRRGPDRPLARGEGRIERSGGKQVAVFRDEEGAFHRLSPRCRHLGCLVAWNAFEKTWDCPCHGGRYAGDGTVLYGPPTRNLAPHDGTTVATEEGTGSSPELREATWTRSATTPRASVTSTRATAASRASGRPVTRTAASAGTPTVSDPARRRRRPTPAGPKDARRDDEAVEIALEDSFPASDPPALTPATVGGARRSGGVAPTAAPDVPATEREACEERERDPERAGTAGREGRRR